MQNWQYLQSKEKTSKIVFFLISYQMLEIDFVLRW